VRQRSAHSPARTKRPRETLRIVYDVELADRIRAVVHGEPRLAGNAMAVSASSQGGLRLRIDPAGAESLISEPYVRCFQMRGRKMDGLLRVDAGVVGGADDLRGRVRHGVMNARSLVPK